jgi:protein O-mannosyl-transferase
MSNKKAKRAKKERLQEETASKLKSSDQKNILLFALIAAAAGFIIYASSLSYGLVHFDDQKHIEVYKPFNEDISNISKTFSKPTFGVLYRPVLSISYILDTNIWGSEPQSYHITNVLLHASCCFFVFILLGKLRFDKYLALFATLFYAVSPILTPAIAWIPGRNDPLVTLFVLLSFINFIAWMDAEKSKKTIYMLLNFLFFAISVYTKETAILQPIMFAIYIFLDRNENPFKSKYIPFYVVWIVIIAIFFLMRSSATEGLKASGEVGISAFINNIPAFFAIAGKIFLPVKMNGCAQFEDFSTYTGIAATLALIAIVFVIPKDNRKQAMFGLLWYFIFLAPTFAVLFTQADFDYLEHRAYLPLIGILILLLSLLTSSKINPKGQKFMAVAGVLIVIFAIRTYAYESNFKDRETFWSHSMKVYPDKAVGYISYAKYLYHSNKMKESQEHYLKAEQIEPDNIGLHVDLAALYYMKKEYAQAEKHSLKAMDLDPKNITAANNLGAIYAVKGDWQSAEKYFEIVTRREQYNPDWYYNLGLAYVQNKKFDKAIIPLQKALKINPNLAKIYYPLYQSYNALGNAVQARQALERALQLQPKNQAMNNELIRFYLRTGNLDKARDHAKSSMSHGGKIDVNLRKQLGL